ncbi:MAG: hypothetical protein HY064_14450 [Bacteroidetes bacterium]|nr:hypothetical protein [Bacteroidota bacterium]
MNEKNDFPLLTLDGILRESVINKGTPKEQLGYILELPGEELRIGAGDSDLLVKDVFAEFVNKNARISGHRFLSVFFVKTIIENQELPGNV